MLYLISLYLECGYIIFCIVYFDSICFCLRRFVSLAFLSMWSAALHSHSIGSECSILVHVFSAEPWSFYFWNAVFTQLSPLWKRKDEIFFFCMKQLNLSANIARISLNLPEFSFWFRFYALIPTFFLLRRKNNFFFLAIANQNSQNIENYLFFISHSHTSLLNLPVISRCSRKIERRMEMGNEARPLNNNIVHLQLFVERRNNKKKTHI